ncbi:MAG: NADH-quinone oxidoreductase subunit A [Alphaproteobacteria bacterium]|nr:NADH-quinone oxidoreductase subunit A [Alphaproteobacteria bacterium]
MTADTLTTSMPTANLLANYFPIIIFMVVAFGLSAIILVASRLLVKQRPYTAKNDPYECGFPAFAETRHQFDVRFYLVSILFIIFDLEVAFLFPWAVSLKSIGGFGFWSMLIFLAVLTIGFIYEWRKGALDWE